MHMKACAPTDLRDKCADMPERSSRPRSRTGLQVARHQSTKR